MIQPAPDVLEPTEPAPEPTPAVQPPTSPAPVPNEAPVVDQAPVRRSSRGRKITARKLKDYKIYKYANILSMDNVCVNQFCVLSDSELVAEHVTMFEKRKMFHV